MPANSPNQPVTPSTLTVRLGPGAEPVGVTVILEVYKYSVVGPRVRQLHIRALRCKDRHSCRWRAWPLLRAATSLVGVALGPQQQWCRSSANEFARVERSSGFHNAVRTAYPGQ